MVGNGPSPSNKNYSASLRESPKMRKGMIKYSDDPIGATIQERVSDGSKLSVLTKNAKCVPNSPNPFKLGLIGSGIPKEHITTPASDIIQALGTFETKKRRKASERKKSQNF